MTKEEFANVTLPLAAAFPFPMAPAWLKLLWETLKHFDTAHVKTAVDRAVLTHEHPSHPPIATLLRYADEAANGIEMTAEKAVTLVWQAVRKHGDGTVDGKRKAREELGPRIMQSVDACGGFGRFADCGADGKGTLVAQFRQAWDQQVRRDEQARRLPAVLLPRVNGQEHQLRIEVSGTPRLVAQGANP